MEPEIRYTTTADGVSIAYYTMGEGLPIVVTSNIWGSHLLLGRNLRRPYFETLERHHTVVRYNGRGSGLSQRKSPDFSLSRVASSTWRRSWSMWGSRDSPSSVINMAASLLWPMPPDTLSE
jgi:pimeloyl-ACP methyl ester carboxylesterase